MHWMRQLATFFRNPATFSYRPALDWLLHRALRCFREEEAFDAIVEDKAAREEFRWQVRFAEVLLRGLIKEKAAEIIYYQVHPEEALPRAQRPDARPSDLKPRKRRPARLFPRLGPPRFHLRTPPLLPSKRARGTLPPQSGLRPDCSPSRGSTEPAPSPASEGGEKQGSGMTNSSSVLPREGEVASGSEPVGAPCRTPNAAPSAPAAPGQLPLPGEHGSGQAGARTGMTQKSSVLPREGEVASGSEPEGASSPRPNAAPPAPAAPGQLPLPGEHGSGQAGARAGMTQNSSVLPREGEVASGSEPVGASSPRPNAAPSAPAAPGQLPLPGEHGSGQAGARAWMTQNSSILPREGEVASRSEPVGAPCRTPNAAPSAPAAPRQLPLPGEHGFGQAGASSGMTRPNRPSPNSPPRLMLRLIAVHNARKNLEKFAWRYAKAEARRKAKWAALGGKGAPPPPRKVVATIARITEPSSADPPASAPWRAETAP